MALTLSSAMASSQEKKDSTVNVINHSHGKTSTERLDSPRKLSDAADILLSLSGSSQNNIDHNK